MYTKLETASSVAHEWATYRSAAACGQSAAARSAHGRLTGHFTAAKVVPLVQDALRRWPPTTLQPDDLIQEGALLVAQRIEAYDPGVGKFETWLHPRLKYLFVDRYRSWEELRNGRTSKTHTESEIGLSLRQLADAGVCRDRSAPMLPKVRPQTRSGRFAAY